MDSSTNGLILEGCCEVLRSALHFMGETRRRSSSQVEHYFWGLQVALEMLEIIAFPKAQALDGLRATDLSRNRHTQAGRASAEREGAGL